MSLEHAPRRLLKTPQAARYLNVSVSWLNKSRLTGMGPIYVTQGRSIAYDIADLDRWIEQNKRCSTSEPRDAS